MSPNLRTMARRTTMPHESSGESVLAMAEGNLLVLVAELSGAARDTAEPEDVEDAIMRVVRQVDG